MTREAITRRLDELEARCEWHERHIEQLLRIINDLSKTQVVLGDAVLAMRRPSMN